MPKLYEGDHAYILQLADRRIVFAIPYQGQTEIGTTDVPVDRPEDAVIDDGEIAYLCDAANQHFTRQITPADVTSTWSGVRPLYDDGASEAKAVTRDYVLELDTLGDTGAAPLLSVFGGKITTARHLAEEVLEKIAPTLGITARQTTRDRAFPGAASRPSQPTSRRSASGGRSSATRAANGWRTPMARCSTRCSRASPTKRASASTSVPA
ncbi:FAD-dependent oxidoreductase [Sphingomonas aurantiaca]|uniref:FAD-dependent oxidoreductase n=1 Tax=Sphingomonas aurantiaca TaxID=185949 RepID=UPI002FDF382E